MTALIVCIIGALLYLIVGPKPEQPGLIKVSEIGRLMFFASLLVALYIFK